MPVCRSRALGTDVFLPCLIPPPVSHPFFQRSAGGPRGGQGSFIALGGSESFFRSCKNSVRLLKCVVLKAVREQILNGGDRYKMSGASFTALGSNLCFCWSYLPSSPPPCCKLLPGFDEEHVCAEIHRLSCFFSAFSATSFSVSCAWFGAVRRALHAQLVCRRAVREAGTLSLVPFARVCLQCLQRPLAAAAGTSELAAFLPGPARARGRRAVVSDTLGEPCPAGIRDGCCRGS